MPDPPKKIAMIIKPPAQFRIFQGQFVVGKLAAKLIAPLLILFGASNLFRYKIRRQENCRPLISLLSGAAAVVRSGRGNGWGQKGSCA